MEQQEFYRFQPPYPGLPGRYPVLPGMNPALPGQSAANETQRLIELLVNRTGQPREKVEAWVTGAFKVMQGSTSVYELSRNIGNFVMKRAKDAKPYVLSFSRSLLQNFVEEQRRLAEERRKEMEIRPTISRHARSADRVYNKSYTASAKKSKNRTHKRVQAERMPGKESQFTVSSEDSPNPWASVEVLAKEPIYITSYRHVSSGR